MRPLDSQTILVTGATDGLGLGLAEGLAGRGATVLVHGRHPQRVERALVAVGGTAHSDRVHGLLADFASLEAVRRLARDVTREFGRLDALVNNAGIADVRGPRQLSADGIELTFAVNHVAGFLLTNGLLPLLAGSAPARVINVASAGQAPIDFDDTMLERDYDGYRAYAQSKLAQISFTIELAERLAAEGQKVTVNALHPATLMDTKMVRQSFGAPASTVAEGVEATLRLVCDPELEGVSGRYFDGLAESRAHAQAYDPEARRRLWKLSERLASPAPGHA